LKNVGACGRTRKADYELAQSVIQTGKKGEKGREFGKKKNGLAEGGGTLDKTGGGGLGCED